MTFLALPPPRTFKEEEHVGLYASVVGMSVVDHTMSAQYYENLSSGCNDISSVCW
jgi:hypothetical protein